MAFVFACRLEELTVGAGRQLELGGQPVAVFHAAEGYFACRGVCPHRGGPLGEGTLEGKLLTCPWHAWTFDLATSRCVAPAPNSSLQPYATRVEGGALYVEVA